MSEETGLKDGFRKPTLNRRLEFILDCYLTDLSKKPRDSWPSDADIGEQVLSDMKQHIESVNRTIARGETRERMISEIPPGYLAKLLCHLHHFVRIDYTESGLRGVDPVLAVYQETGKFAGTYTVNDKDIMCLMRTINLNMSVQNEAVVFRCLQMFAPVAKLCRDPRYIAVNNGIWDDEDKKLLPFTPDMVFTSKLMVDYNPYASDVPIQEPDGCLWTVENWFKSINSDPDNVRFLWDTLAMAVRPNRCSGKVVFLYSDKGSNGKGTYCQLMKNLLGDGNYDSLSIADFGRPFMLSNLPYVQAVITDENAVGDFVEDVSALKAIVTGDNIQVNRKFKDSISMKFYGIVVQCINGFPKFRDQSNSLLRRIAMIGMDQCFIGREKKYIKHDYLGRKPVLEYVLKKLLYTDITDDTMRVPKRGDELLQQYREYNDPVFEFWNEFREEFVWDLLPYTFLYDFFKQWFKKTHPSGKLMSYKQFLQNLRASVESTGGWDVSNVSIRSFGKMDKPERLIVDYDLLDWMDGMYAGDDWQLKVLGKKKVSYRGLQRV